MYTYHQVPGLHSSLPGVCPSVPPPEPPVDGLLPVPALRPGHPRLLHGPQVHGGQPGAGGRRREPVLLVAVPGLPVADQPGHPSQQVCGCQLPGPVDPVPGPQAVPDRLRQHGPLPAVPHLCDDPPLRAGAGRGARTVPGATGIPVKHPAGSAAGN